MSIDIELSYGRVVYQRLECCKHSIWILTTKVVISKSMKLILLDFVNFYDVLFLAFDTRRYRSLHSLLSDKCIYIR